MLNEHHIDQLEIKNFKCFEHLKMKSIRQVNLIGGKNNVGKTSLLEAIELFSSAKSQGIIAESIHQIFKRRQPLSYNNESLEFDFFYKNEDNFLISTSLKEVAVFFGERVIQEQEESSNNRMPNRADFPRDFLISLNNKKRYYHLSRLLSMDYGISPAMRKRNNNEFPPNNFIESKSIAERRIAILYGSLVDLDREAFLNQSLSLFDENIVSIKQRATEHSGVILKLKLKDRDTPVLLSSLGEGVNRYIAILCAIWASKDGVLLVDEIENGIHYSNYEKLWELIHQASLDANCQIFVTTHSKECIEAFNSVQLSYKEADSAYFELYKNVKKNIIQITHRDAQQLQYALQHEGKIRGE